MPPFEAMATGLPVIVSRENGTSEVITHGVDGLVLEDATDANSLAAMIRKIMADQKFATNLGSKAAETAQRFTWESNVKEFRRIFLRVFAKNNFNSSQGEMITTDPAESPAQK
jgi:glycosyltransferase involved in cell wall biosynthesis